MTLTGTELIVISAICIIISTIMFFLLGRLR